VRPASARQREHRAARSSRLILPWFTPGILVDDSR
jgi:hypothetical protein